MENLITPPFFNNYIKIKYNFAKQPKTPNKIKTIKVK